MENLAQNVLSYLRTPPAGLQRVVPVVNYHARSVRTVFAHWSDALCRRVRGSRPRAAIALRAARLRSAEVLRRVAVTATEQGRWLPIGLSLAGALAAAAVLRTYRSLRPDGVRDYADRLIWGEVDGRPQHFVVFSGPRIPEADLLGLEGELQWCEQLAAHLQIISLFRRRDRELLIMLRNRAVVWCREHHIPDVEANEIIAGSVVRAFAFSEQEAQAMDALRSDAVVHAIAQSGLMHSGSGFTGSRAGFYAWFRGACSMADALRAWRYHLWAPSLAIPVS